MQELLFKRIIWTLVALLAASLALLGALDRTGEEFADAAFKRALFTFAAARGLNSAISVAQGTELAVEPGGVGVIVSIGEALDPVNDLVEQFSTVMLVATSSLGLQNILLDMTSWWGVTTLSVAAAIWVLLTTWLPNQQFKRFAPSARRILLVAIFIRFAMPILMIATTWTFNTFLAAEQAEATAALEAATTQVETINSEADAPEPTENPSLLDRLDAALDEALAAMQIGDRLERLQTALSDASEHVINLIVIFLLQTVVLPIVFVWLIAEALKSLGSRLIGRD